MVFLMYEMLIKKKIGDMIHTFLFLGLMCNNNDDYSLIETIIFGLPI